MANQPKVRPPGREVDCNQVFQKLQRLDAQIKIEYELIGHRVGWLLFANSFLLSAFVLALSKEPKGAAYDGRAVEMLLWLLPIFGVMACSLVFFGVVAAHISINQLKDKRDTLENSCDICGFEKLGVQQNDWKHVVGNLSPTLFPILLGLIWGLLLVRRAI